MEQQQGTIRVMGRATRWVEADHVDVGFTISRRAGAAADAVAEGSAAWAALDVALTEAADLVVRRTTTSLVVREVVRYEPETGRNLPDGFIASRVELARFAPVSEAGTVVGSVVAAVADLGVETPTFGVADDHPVHGEVRAEAAAEAMRAAEAYASGVGRALGAVVRLSEPGEREVQPIARTMALAAKALPPEGGDTVLVELSAEQVEVSAAIELVVALA